MGVEYVYPSLSEIIDDKVANRIIRVVGEVADMHPGSLESIMDYNNFLKQEESGIKGGPKDMVVVTGGLDVDKALAVLKSGRRVVEYEDNDEKFRKKVVKALSF